MDGRYEVHIRPDRRRGFGVMPTNDDLTLVIAGWPIAEFEANKTDVEGNYLKRSTWCRRSPTGSGPPVAKAGSSAPQCRSITDAFRDAGLCAAALHEALSASRPFDAAMTRYQSIRDRHVLPMYEFTTQLATLEPPPPELARLLVAAGGIRDASDAFARVDAGVMSAAEFLSDASAERIRGGEADRR